MNARTIAASLSLLAGCASHRLPVAPSRPGPDDAVVFHEVSFEVRAPRDRFVVAFLAAPLERFIKGTAALPGVVRTEPMTELRFPAVGSVRRVVLRDGNTAHEEVLECDDHRLRYWVTNYTSPEAKPIEWGLGEFTFEPAGPITRVRWRYSFKLRGDRFPGWLGPIGRGLFRSRFLEREYAEFMNAQVAEIQAFAAREVPQ
jgi:hypothetical protein